MRRISLTYIALLFCLAFAGHTYFFHLTEQVSMSGFSAIETMVQTLKPENFKQDFPNGNVSGAKHAIISIAYAPLHMLTGLSGLTLLTIMIGLEVACVIGAAWVLWSRFVPNDNLRIGLFCWLATILVASFVLRPNLSNFGYPFFHGQFYGFADAVSMLAIAAFFSRRWALVAVVLCVGFMIHPTKTLMSASFIAGASLMGGRETLNLKSIIAGVITTGFAAAWGYFWLGFGQPDNIPPIPADQYIAYTRGWQYHWYPFDRGLLAENRYNSLSPFLALLLIGALALVKSAIPSAWRKQLLGGMAVLAVLTIAGLWFSYALTSVFMIKMALNRASEMMTLLVPFIVLAAVHHQWQLGRWGWVILFAGFLLGGITKAEGLSVLVGVFAIAAYFFSERKRRILFTGEYRSADRLLAAIALILSLLITAISIKYPTGSAATPVLSSLTFIAVAWLACARRITKFFATYTKLQPATISWALLSIAFFSTAAFYLKDMYWMDAARIAKSRDYYEVQLWAKKETRPDALFMAPSCYAYGWREFSERSSVGNAFEWFHTGWLYVSDNRVFERGQSIRKTLGLDFDNLLPKPGERAKHINYDVCAMAEERFYDPSLRPIKRMAKEQGVDYFVMENQRSEALVTKNHLKPVFANSHYRVFAAKQLP